MVNKIRKHIFDIRPSKIHGVGLFTVIPVAKDSIVFECQTEIKDNIFFPIHYLRTHGITNEQIKILQKWYAHTTTHIQIPKNFNPYALHIVSLMNHSPRSTLYYTNGKYYAKRNLKKNTELTLDYSHKNYHPIDFI